jgi:hypothetical protein
MGRSTVHYADHKTNNILKRLHNKLRPAGTPHHICQMMVEREKQENKIFNKQ